MNLQDKLGQLTVNRFWNKVKKTDSCWEWLGSKDSGGYGNFKLNKTLIGAHRFSFILTKGLILKDLQIDHLCRNRGCVNPQHMELVTQQENIKRGFAGYGKCAVGSATRNGKKTHCLRGHEFTPENTYRYPDGHRNCRICQLNHQREYRLKKSKGGKNES